MVKGTQRIVIVLLVLSIIFSAMSIFASFSILNINLPQRGGSGSSGISVPLGDGAGDVSLFVEKNPSDIIGVGNG